MSQKILASNCTNLSAPFCIFVILLPVFLPGLSMSIGISKFGLNGDEYIIIIARYPVIGGRKVKDKFDGIF